MTHRESERRRSEPRAELLEALSGLGPRTFEQCAGFVRVRGGANPLDASAVHPERYALVERIAKDAGVAVALLVGNARGGRGDPVAEATSPPTSGSRRSTTSASELEKPGRDPRDAFEPPSFRDDVRTIEDLKPGMALDGVVTNVTAFGAFVDVGVHQDGLVHVSQLADRFVKDPHQVAKVGDKVKVRVIEVDLARKRIALTAKSGAPKAQPSSPSTPRSAPRQGAPVGNAKKSEPTFSNNPFAGLLKKQ